MATAVWLVRHGERIDETPAFERWASETPRELWFDPHLTKGGIAQAAAAGRLLAATRGTFARVYVSPAMRCVETASEVCGAVGHDMHLVAGLGECAKVVERRGLRRMLPLFPHNRDGGDGTSVAHAAAAPVAVASVDETDETFLASVKRLAKRHVGDTVVLVTHREGIRALMRIAKGAAPGGRRHATPYAAVCKAVVYADDKPMRVDMVYDPVSPVDERHGLPLPDPHALPPGASVGSVDADDTTVAGGGSGSGCGSGSGGGCGCASM